MKNLKSTRTIVLIALFMALTFVATTFIKVNTIRGYIHPGDSLVILSGIVLGPVGGGLAAGIGSMFADLLLGYFVPYGPATLIIKALAAVAAGVTYGILKKKTMIPTTLILILSGIASEVIVVVGYGVFESYLYGVAGALPGVITNLVQATAGIVLAIALYPILSKIPMVQELLPKRKTA